MAESIDDAIFGVLGAGAVPGDVAAAAQPPITNRLYSRIIRMVESRDDYRVPLHNG